MGGQSWTVESRSVVEFDISPATLIQCGDFVKLDMDGNCVYADPNDRKAIGRAKTIFADPERLFQKVAVVEMMPR
jgi:hypothetical protein